MNLPSNGQVGGGAALGAPPPAGDLAAGWAEIIATVRTEMRAMAAALVPALQQLAAPGGVFDGLLHPLVYPRLRAAYEQVGSPYGPDDAAMWRWWREVAAAARDVAQEQGERTWQQAVAAVRRQMEANHAG